MAAAVYLLCALTSLGCTILLWRAWHARRVPLLLWSAAAFACFTLNNILLVLDRLVVGADRSLLVERSVPLLLGVALFVYGLVWES
ncbi:MAG TPA: DUF5985 family protein [Gemmatimonadales bacterium]|nr:DUF5985 family protein [Gemmatimonadales bacterium]